MILAGALFLSAAASSMLHAQRPAPDLILSNGKIITVDEKFTIAQAVAIRGDRVVAVGSNQAITPLAGPSTRTIDLKGKALIPGLIDNHMHLLRGGTSWKYEVRLDGVATRKQAMAMLTERTKQVGPGQWVYTLGGFAREQFSDDPKAFTTAELDKAFPNNPVALQESYYRFNANSQALKMMGFDEKAMGDVGQGGVGRLAAKLPLATKDEIEASSLGMLKDMNRWGLTAFGVPGCDKDLVQMYRKWESNNQLNARVFCIDGAGGGGGRGAAGVDNTIAQIAQIKKFQGDDYVDDIVYGEGVYGGGDPMFLVKSDPKPEDLVLWRRVGLALAQLG